jgi:hypothetical protein
VDDAALTDLLHGSRRSPKIFRKVAELDLNPVVALPHGRVAVDARIRMRLLLPQSLAKTW